MRSAFDIRPCPKRCVPARPPAASISTMRPPRGAIRATRAARGAIRATRGAIRATRAGRGAIRATRGAIRATRAAIVVALASLSVPSTHASAQETPQQTPQPGSSLRVFLDCERCDFDHLRREVPVVDYVRDRTDADVHVLVTQQQTGAGGSEYLFFFLGQRELAGRADTLRYVSPQFQTEDEERDGYTRTFSLGLVRYLTYASMGDQIDVDFPEAEEGAPALTPQEDPWDLWVFRASVGAELEGESRRSDTSLDGSFSASRVTEEFKIDVNVRGDYERRTFEIDDSTEVHSVRSLEAEGTAVWSLGPNWSWGFSGAVGSDQSMNQAFYGRVAPALEYSVYPYAESTRRQITATYRVGVATFEYDEITFFQRLAETRPEHSLEVSADFTQPWGELLISLEGSNFLDDFNQHRVSLFTNIEVRLFRGLNLDIRGNIARIQDQIFLSAGGLTPEEIFIGQREIGTDYEYSMEVGLSFTFGSLFNNVVNPRLRSGGNDFDRF